MNHIKTLAILACILLIPWLCQAQTDPKQLHRDFSNPLVREECLVVRITADNKIMVDSIIPQNFVSRCEGYQGAVAFVRDTMVSDANIFYLNQVILQDRTDFVMMCGMKYAIGPILCTNRAP